MIPEIWSVKDSFFSDFGQFFALSPPPPLNNPKNQNFEKMKKKKNLEISSFYHSVP